MNRTKRFVGWFICFGLIFLMLSCTAYRDGSVLVEYVNQDILGISELEVKALGHYAAVTGKNFTTNEEVYEALKNDVIPTYQRFLYLLKKIDPKIDEIRQLHAVYVRGAGTLYSGLKSKMIGIEKQNQNQIKTADQEIAKGAMETFKWRNGLTAMYEKYNVK